ncbi:MAG TPA: DUF89 family protein [Methanosphaera sp.]|nr:DUF89 family protein [Methanosphaera sp.]HII09299.1 DUF89 family protein [Methanosphaera sp.]HIJ15480.1 DUF89 family protein [Methanosphaera sp.]
MKVNYECASCMLRQSREAIEHATENHEKRMDVTLKVLNFMNENFRKGTNSNKLGTDLHHMIMTETNNNDPYKKLREEGNEIAQRLIPMVNELIEKDESLENYVKIAVAGNVIDFGALDENTDMESLLKRQITRKPAINETKSLDMDLKKAKNILFLTDNGGEIVFDKLLIKKIKEDYDVNITVALKENPILNDALIPDAEKLNIDKYAHIISTGASSVGVVKDYISKELKEYMDSVDLIISKGMGNYEGLTEMHIETPVFFLLTTKCNVISREIGVPLGSPVIVKKNLS